MRDYYGKEAGGARTGEGHLGAELLFEGPQVVAGGERLVHVLAEHRLGHQPRLYLVVRLRARFNPNDEPGAHPRSLKSPLAWKTGAKST